MKKSLLLLFAIFFTLNFTSCNNDDDSSSDDEVEEEDRDSRAELDAVALEDFMKTHTYNVEDFLAQEHMLTDQDIVFSKITDGETSLWDLKITKTLKFIIDETLYEEDYFIIEVRKGEGKEIRCADNIELTFQEKLIVSETEYPAQNTTETFLVEDNRDVIENRERRNTLSFSSIGLSDAYTHFKTGKSISDNPCEIFEVSDIDGSLSNNNFGIGIVIVPSGLAYFSTEQFYNNERADDNDDDTDEDAVEDEDFYAYRNYVYTFSTYNAVDANLDGDSIPAYIEGVNEFIDSDGDGVVDSKGIDTDEDGLPDYLDDDDDGDEVFTINEVLIGDIDATMDADCDGVLNNDIEVQFIYLEKGEVTSLRFVSPENSITEQGIPFHLDKDVEYDEEE